MKSFKTCPSCHSDLVNYHSGGLYIQSCKLACSTSSEPCKDHPCPIQFRQSFHSSFEDSTIRNFQIYTKHFYLYKYSPFHLLFQNETHIYHRFFPRGASSQMPVFKVKDLILDITDPNSIEKFDNKYHILSTFI